MEEDRPLGRSMVRTEVLWPARRARSRDWAGVPESVGSRSESCPEGGAIRAGWQAGARVWAAWASWTELRHVLDKSRVGGVMAAQA